MRALVTGAGGFVGPYLVRFLLFRGYEVFGAFHKKDWESGKSKDNFGNDPGPGSFHPVFLDVTDVDSVRNVLERARPDEIYHLAAVSVTTGISPEVYYRVNFQGTFHLFRAGKEIVPEARVLYVGTANAYGVVKAEDLPVKEDRPLCPNNHYAASKAAAENLACAYAAEGLRVVRARPFNHTGPGQTTDFVCSRLAREIAAIALGRKEPVVVAGNLDSARDFTDVRDVVEAYWLLLQKGRIGEVYNVCSQKAYTVKEIIEILMKKAGTVAVVDSSSALRRKSDIPVLLGSREKISRETGWKPKIAFEETLNDVLDYWLRTLR